MANPHPIDRGWILRRLTDWQLQLPFELAHQLSLEPMDKLVDLVDGLVLCAERDEARKCADRAKQLWEGDMELTILNAHDVAAAVRGFEEEGE